MTAALVTAAVCAVAGLLAGRRSLPGAVTGASVWTRPAVVAALAGLGGAGSALLATGAGDRVGFAALAVGCALMVAADLHEHRIPDRFLAPTAAVLGMGLVTAVLVGSPGWGDLLRAFGGAAAAGAGLLLLALVSPRSLGLGDVKLGALLGCFLGWFSWQSVLVGLALAFVVGGAAALALVLTRRAHAGTAIAFGPPLVLGAAAAAALAHLG